jgi:hypothetical protein
MGFEHRKSLRVKTVTTLYFWSQAEVQGEGGGLWGTIVDLSVSGLAFYTKAALQKGQPLTLELTLPGEARSLRLAAKVVLCEAEGEGGSRLVRSQFTALMGEERQRLMQAILVVSDPPLAAASGWGKAYFPDLPAMELRYREMPPGLMEKWLADRSYLDIKGLIYLKHFQDHLERMLGNRGPGAFRLLGSRPLKEGAAVWIELALPMGQLHCVAQALWSKQDAGERAECGLQLRAFQKEEAMRLEKTAATAW